LENSGKVLNFNSTLNKSGILSNNNNINNITNISSNPNKNTNFNPNSDSNPSKFQQVVEKVTEKHSSGKAVSKQSTSTTPLTTNVRLIDK